MSGVQAGEKSRSVAEQNERSCMVIRERERERESERDWWLFLPLFADHGSLILADHLP